MVLTIVPKLENSTLSNIPSDLTWTYTLNPGMMHVINCHRLLDHTSVGSNIGGGPKRVVDVKGIVILLFVVAARWVRAKI